MAFFGRRTRKAKSFVGTPTQQTRKKKKLADTLRAGTGPGRGRPGSMSAGRARSLSSAIARRKTTSRGRGRAFGQAVRTAAGAPTRRRKRPDNLSAVARRVGGLLGRR